jgi:hypothetical protein
MTTEHIRTNMGKLMGAEAFQIGDWIEWWTSLDKSPRSGRILQIGFYREFHFLLKQGWRRPKWHRLQAEQVGYAADSSRWTIRQHLYYQLALRRFEKQPVSGDER